ncbi:MAG: 6-carboxytetrahydropterin synthase QueD [Chloroflexi bacterium]|nr:6-carboxytetrahydropterin synthase QueD [Ardenticatenaceae bacterium]MBL1128430.1 6-carboxytetrahydropterin synthase QueD [Chloroflexota bacterium]NOG34507.1 6-carboxytetrahydropterin synthase QueD [Chloroflexota bacterium]GIK58887.1 MAG: 6-carboxy-5,6,7,8-tetrahydropterin synthase [Chloroflexota bacterium]
MYTISKQFHFSASHQLDGLPTEHQCARLHGHNYEVELILQSETLDEYGFVVDYLALKTFKTYLDETLDHRHLNDVLPFPTTAENLARHLYAWAKVQWPQVTAVRVSETPRTWAEYRP